EVSDRRMLLLGRKSEFVQKLAYGNGAAPCHGHHFGNVFYDVNQPLLIIKGKLFLLVISESGGLPDLDFSAVGWQLSDDHIQKGGFPHTVGAHYTNFIAFFKGVAEIL